MTYPELVTVDFMAAYYVENKKLFGVTFFSPTREGVYDQLWFLYLFVRSLAARLQDVILKFCGMVDTSNTSS